MATPIGFNFVQRTNKENMEIEWSYSTEESKNKGVHGKKEEINYVLFIPVAAYTVAI
jgi:hypothetical protein